MTESQYFQKWFLIMLATFYMLCLCVMKGCARCSVGFKHGTLTDVLMFRYEPQAEGMDEGRRKQQLEKINTELLKKLQELDTDIIFSTGEDLSSSDHKNLTGCINLPPLVFHLLLSPQALSLGQRRTVSLSAWSLRTSMFPSWWRQSLPTGGT